MITFYRSARIVFLLFSSWFSISIPGFFAIFFPRFWLFLRRWGWDSSRQEIIWRVGRNIRFWNRAKNSISSINVSFQFFLFTLLFLFFLFKFFLALFKFTNFFQIGTRWAGRIIRRFLSLGKFQRFQQFYNYYTWWGEIISIEFFCFLYQHQLATIRDGARIIWTTFFIRWLVFNFSNDLLTRNDLSENNVKTVQMRGLLSRHEELRTICIFTPVSHWEQKWSVMFPFEIFIIKITAINGLTSSATMLTKISTLFMFYNLTRKDIYFRSLLSVIKNVFLNIPES